MCTSNNINVALVLYTQGLDYDDRIRKEILSIRSMFPNVSFKIFAVEPKNREEEGVTSYGIPYRIPYLKTRDKYSSASHTLAKSLDFYKSIKKDLKGFDVLWCADVETFPFVLLKKGMPIVWDHHELPEFFMKKSYMRLIYKYMERKCRVVIHANKPRLDHMKELGLVSNINKHFVLRNYPDFNEIDTEYDNTYLQFDEWLGDGKCVYLQGINMKRRADKESIEAILATPKLKAVIIGSVRPDLQIELLQKHSEQELKERLFFTGRIKQLKTPQYIRRCFMSLVFYKNTSANNWYCEPNRLFQNIINGNPVVVGNNPPMKDLVDGNDFGITIETDGTDVDKIIEGVKALLSNYSIYKNNVDKNNGMLLWAKQEGVIREIVSLIIRKDA